MAAVWKRKTTNYSKIDCEKTSLRGPKNLSCSSSFKDQRTLSDYNSGPESSIVRTANVVSRCSWQYILFGPPLIGKNPKFITTSSVKSTLPCLGIWVAVCVFNDTTQIRKEKMIKNTLRTNGWFYDSELRGNAEDIAAYYSMTVGDKG